MTERNYQVLARKWRPRRFDDVVGQTAAVRTLRNALDQNRLAHAYCFSGIRGVGKTTMARLLAMGLNCNATDGPTSAPCGTCESCSEIESSRSLDVVELDAASRTGVDDIRELNEVARYAPSRDRYRVFIIDEAHMLSTAANNALLKTLEEPPARVVFILATTEPSKILPTVLSRCQYYQFGRISQGEIGGHLAKIASAENVQISADALALLATAADGSLRDAQSLLDKLVAFGGEEIDERTVIDLLGLVDRVLLFRSTDLIAAGDLAGALGFVNEMVDNGIDLHQFAVDLMGHFRDLLVVRTVPEPGVILHLPEDDLQRLREQAAGFEIEDLDRAFSLLAASEYRIKMAAQPRYHVEIVLARLARLPRLQPIDDLLAALRAGKTDSGTSGGRGATQPGAGAGSAKRPGNASTGSRRVTPKPSSASKAPASATRDTGQSAGTHLPPTPARPKPEGRAAPRAPAPQPPRVATEPDLPPWITEPPPVGEPVEKGTRATPPREAPLAVAAVATEVRAPVVVAAKPAAAAPEPVVVAPKPVAAAPEPVIAATDPAVVAPEPVMVAAEPVLVAPGPVVTTAEPTQPRESVPTPAPVEVDAANVAAAQVPTPEPVAEPAAVLEDLPAPALLRRIQEQLEESYPLIAQVLGRSCGISMAGEIVSFQFPESAGIFAERVRDPEVLARLSEVGQAVLGRRVIARVEMVAGGTRLAEPTPAAAAEPNDEQPARVELSSAVQPPAAAVPEAATGTGTPPSPADLRQRAEQEPRVQEMLRALKGHLVSVEEL